MQKFLFFSLLFLFAVDLNAQKLFERITAIPAEVMIESNVEERPFNYQAVHIDFPEFLLKLNQVSDRSAKEISLPTPEGDMLFVVQEYSMMQEGLARKYPNIKTYKGSSKDGKASVRFDVGAYGLHASIEGKDKEMYISPVSRNNKDYYYAYYLKDLPNQQEPMKCGLEQEGVRRPAMTTTHTTDRSKTSVLQEYRLAVACTGEWGAVRGTKEKALSDIVTTVNRLNQIFEQEISVTLKLIDRNDELIFLDAGTDPYPVGNVGEQIAGQNTTVLNNLIGVGNYDIGHVYTNRCTDVGGVVVGAGQVCANGKGNGVSCFTTSVLGTTNRVVSHEVGHQFSASHTFHSCLDDPLGSFRGGRDFEPGSGSTIMSYAGTCGTDNIVSNNDNYFHNASLIEMYNYLRNPTALGYSCANLLPMGNSAPAIQKITPSGYTIPIKTPFILNATAIDVDGDTLTYCWEQKDSTVRSTPLGMPEGNDPLFRSYPPVTRSYRTLPTEIKIISNVGDIVEILPTYTRKMNFAVTVRDNNDENGLATWEYVSMSVTDKAGPFVITAPNESLSLKGGDPVVVKWDVSNTDLAPVNCRNVDIYLTTDYSLNTESEKLILLTSGTQNDGEAVVYMPDVTTTTGRLIVKSAKNIFFDVSNVNLTIAPSEAPKATFLISANETKLCLPAVSTVSINSKSIGGYNGDIIYAIDGLVPGIEAKFEKQTTKVGAENSLLFSINNDVPTGSYEFVVYAIDDQNDTTFQTITYDVTSTNFEDLAPLAPETGTKNFEGLPTFTWTSAFNADTYTLEVSKDPRFLQDQIEISIVTPDTVKLANKTLDKAEIYYWRVKASNSCGEDYSDVFAFGTEVLACKTYVASDLPQNISQSGRPTVESKILIGDNFNITDLNVKSVNIDHDNFKDLKGTLISPTNIAVILWNNQCPRRMNINFGFDNDAPSIFTCATTANAQYKAAEPLDTFNNTASNGTWTLKVEDLVAGNGGSLKGLEIELCGNLEVDNPTVSTNTLQVEYQKTGAISQSLLQAINGNTGPENLIYKIVNDVTFGMITKGGNVLSVGETFSQADVNAGLIAYQNVGPELGPSENATDVLKIIVENGAGGWAGVIDFNILIENTTVSTKDDLFHARLSVYPVPATEEITFIMPDGISAKGRFIIYDLNGRMVSKGNSVEGLNKVNVDQIATGQYFIQVATDKNILTGRFTKVDN